MAIFHRKLNISGTLLNDLAERTLDWSRAVQIPNQAYKLANNIYTPNDSGKYVKRKKLLVNGAIYVTRNSNTRDADLVVDIYTSDKTNRITHTYVNGGSTPVRYEKICPVIKANRYLVIASSNTSLLDWNQYFIIFVPTFGSVGITGIDNFLSAVEADYVYGYSVKETNPSDINIIFDIYL